MANNLLDKASIILTPTAYDNGKALCVKPSDGSGDFDFSRNSAATRVNAQGLVENVQILSSNLVQNGDFSEEGVQEVSNGSFSQEGSELIVNGDFDTDSDWFKSGQVTIGGGVAYFDSDGTFTQIAQNLSGISGKNAKVVIEVTEYNQGTLKVLFSGGAQQNLPTSVGTHTLYFSNVSSNTLNIARVGGVTNIKIDNVSVREVGQDWVIENTWTIGDGVANGNGAVGSTAELKQYNVNTIGKTYKATFEVLNYVSGTVGFWQGSGVTVIDRSANGIYTEYFTATSAEIRFRPNNFNGSVTNISVKEVAQNWTLGTGVSIGSNEAIFTSTPSGQSVGQNAVAAALPNGALAKVSFEVLTRTEGTFGIYFSGTLVGTLASAGVFTGYFTKGTETSFYIRALGTTSGTISNVNVIQISTDTNLPRINYENFSYQDALGSELVVNGTFDTDTAWSKGAGWSIANGTASHIGGTASYLSQSILNPNTQYKVKIKVSQASGSNFVQIYMGGSPASVLIQNVGEYEYIFTSQSSIGLGFALRGAGNVGIDNVSVKEYLGQEVVPDSGCGSWLWEPQSTNLVTQSELFSDSYWSKINSSVTSGFSSPSGGLNAFKLVENTSLGNHVVRKSGLTTASTTTTSIFAKAEQRNKILLFNGVAGYGFNLSNGTTFATSTGIPDAFNITELNNGWYKCSITHSSANRCSVYLINDADSFSYTGDGTSGVYIFGAQVELGTGTSYIPTEGATVTRNQDVCTNGGSSASINNTEGTLYFEGAALANDGTFRQISLTQTAGGGDVITLDYSSSSNGIRSYLRVGAVSQSLTYILSDETQYNKIAVRYKDTHSIWVNGLEVASQALTTLPINLNVLTFDNGSGGGNLYGKTKALAVWKEALSDAELTELTTI